MYISACVCIRNGDISYNYSTMTRGKNDQRKPTFSPAGDALAYTIITRVSGFDDLKNLRKCL